MELYHFSDDPSITCFQPRAITAERPPGMEWLNEPLVWAIDEWHSPMYLFPRQCPRILLWPTPETSRADRDWWMGELPVRMVAYVEKAWEQRWRECELFRYTLPADTFRSLADAGMWVCSETVTPADAAHVTDLPRALREANVEVRIVPSLLPLRGVWDTTLHASGIRLRNAVDWPGSERPPLPSRTRVLIFQPQARAPRRSRYE